MPDNSCPDDNDATNADGTQVLVETTPESDLDRPSPRADPAQQFLTWAALVLIAITAVVVGDPLVNHGPVTTTGMPATPMIEALR